MPWRWGRAGTRSGKRGEGAVLRRILLALLDDDLSEAERNLVALLREDSRDVDLTLALARVFRLRGEVGRAIRVDQNLLLRADLSAEQRLDALLGLAEDFRRGGFLRRALSSYEEVLERNARHTQALRRVAELSAELGDYPRALTATGHLVRRATDKREGAVSKSALLVRMANAEHEAGHDAEARRTLKRALRADPDNVDARIRLGDLEAERGRTRAALAAWRRVPEIDRSHGPRVYPKLASAFAALDRSRGFEEFVKRLLERDADDVDARVALGRALVSRGAIDEGVAEFRRVLDRAPGNREARIALGRSLLAERRETDALKEFAELLEDLGASEDDVAGGPGR